jgi:hypothetical protein
MSTRTGATASAAPAFTLGIDVRDQAAPVWFDAKPVRGSVIRASVRLTARAGQLTALVLTRSRELSIVVHVCRPVDPCH